MRFAVIGVIVLSAAICASADVTWNTISGPVSETATSWNHIGTDGTSLYVVFHNNQLWRYTFDPQNPITGAWTRLADPPRTICGGESYSDLAYQNGYLYTCAVSGSLRTVCRYRISTNSWQVWQTAGGADITASKLTGNGLFMDPARDGVGISVWHAGNTWVWFDWNAKTADNGWIHTHSLPVLDPHWVARTDDVAADGSGSYYATKNDWTAGLSSGDCVYKWTGTSKLPTVTLVTRKPWQAGFGQSLEYVPGSLTPSGHGELWLVRGSNSASAPHEGWGSPTADWARLDLSNVAGGWITGTLPGGIGYNGEIVLIQGCVFVRGPNAAWYVTKLVPVQHDTISIKAAKALADSTPVEVEGAVTAVFANESQFYIQNIDECAAIQVRCLGAAPAMNEVVYVSGRMGTDQITRERYLDADTWSAASSPRVVKPMGMSGNALGGGPTGLQEGLTGRYGLNNVGLLVRSWGAVASVASDNSHFFISDGSGSVKVEMSGVYRPDRPEPAVGEYVCVTGICSMYQQSGEKKPVLRARSGSDVAINGDDGNRPKTFAVLIINLDPIIESQGGRRLHQVLGWNDPHHLAEQYRLDLLACSGGWAKHRVVEWIDADLWAPLVDGFQYTDSTYLACWYSGSGWHQPDGVDYYWLIDHFDLDVRVASGEIDEVWFMGAPYMGFYESRMAGPGAYWCNSPGMSNVNSGRLFIIMGFSYERWIGEMLENFGHRAESIMTHVYGSWHNTYPPQHNWDRFTLYNLIAPGHAACGNVHFAPNSTADYQWGNTTYVWSACDDWLYNWPNLQGDSARRWVNCSEWGGGDMRLHHKWWLNHFPRKPGVNPDGKQNNWWKYLCDYNRYPESR